MNRKQEGTPADGGNGHVRAGQRLAQPVRQIRGPRLAENPADAAGDAGIHREASRGAGDDDHAFLVHVHGGGRGELDRRESTDHVPCAFGTDELGGHPSAGELACGVEDFEGPKDIEGVEAVEERDLYVHDTSPLSRHGQEEQSVKQRRR
ncbi:hypothetical protein [Streptomyces sp. NPDC020480]|uniref:hypothetical protein n=1 Tax=Streptomyces sp. NPDC020480 TaxID=3365076 RepID=UPI003790DA56